MTASDNPVIIERYLREIEKKKETHISAFYPGYLLCQDTFSNINISYSSGLQYPEEECNLSLL